jgi:hypothetical protein
VPFPDLPHNTVIFKIMKGERPKEVCGLCLSKIVWEMVKRCWQQEPDQRPDVFVVLDCLKKAACMPEYVLIFIDVSELNFIAIVSTVRLRLLGQVFVMCLL